MKIYFDLRDWWIGYYRAKDYHYVCPLPCLVIRWRRKGYQERSPFYVYDAAILDAYNSTVPYNQTEADVAHELYEKWLEMYRE